MKSAQRLTLTLIVLIVISLACGTTNNEKLVETVISNAEEITSGSSGGENAGEAPVEEPSEVKPPEPTATTIPEPTEILGLVKIGTYLVGKDIEPGIYWGLAGTDLFDSCYWERLSGISGEFDDILANDNSIGSYYIEVLETDFALKSDCELIKLDNAPAPEMSDSIGPGTYLVGRDIRPGTYQGQAGEDIMDSCYWERKSNVQGGFDGIIANDNATGSFYVQVAESDFAFHTGCPLERVSD